MNNLKCSSCGHYRDVSLFNKNSSCERGYDFYCKECRKKTTRKYYIKHRDQSLAKSKKYAKDNQDKINEAERRRYNPHKQKARNTLVWAVIRGEMIRADKCSHCGSDTYIVGHHADYDKPLDVTWLCRDCHIALHHDYLKEKETISQSANHDTQTDSMYQDINKNTNSVAIDSPNVNKDIENQLLEIWESMFGNNTSAKAGVYVCTYQRFIELMSHQLELARLDGRRIQAEATLDKWNNIDESAVYKFGRFLKAQAESHKYELSELTKK